MGKGTRNRLERAEDKIANPQKYVTKKHAPAFIGPLVFAVVVILLAVVLIGNALVGAGIFMRARTAAESDDFKVDGAMMTYYVNYSYQSYINYFYEMYSSYLSSSSSTLDVYSIMGIDPNISLKKQVYNKETGQTWFDYFADMAKSQIEEQLVYAQAAKAAGVALDEDDYASIDETIATLEEYAEMYGVSLNNYIAINYGNGVREKDVRHAMELSQLASKYAQMINDDLYEASTDEKVNAFYEENKNDYISADYLYYTFTATKNGLAENADELYAQDKAAIEAAADELAAISSVDEFKAYIKNYMVETSLDDYMQQYYDTYLKTAEGETDEEKAAAAEQQVKDKLNEDAQKKADESMTEDLAYTVETDLGAWIFGKEDTDAAAVNTTHRVTDDSKDATGTYTVTVYLLTRAASRNEDTTRTFTYLLFQEPAYDLKIAEEALAAFEEGEKTAEALLTLGKEYSSAISQTMEDVALGTTGSDEVDAWLYTDERQAGDYTLISYTYEDKKYHIIVYVDEVGPAEWYVDCRDAQVADEMSDWYDDASKTYVVTVYDKVVNKVKI